MDKVFFLESINQNIDGRGAIYASLFNATGYFERGDFDIRDYFSVVQVQPDSLPKGRYSGFFTYEDGILSNANTSFVAKHYIAQNAYLRNRLISRIADQPVDIYLSDRVYSYHVNVGHGNCSFIVDADRREVWLVDCSDFDYREPKNYKGNINSCINHIKGKFNITDFKITLIVLTHPHFDHYSGISGLINSGYIDGNTLAYINVFYSMPSPKYNDLLKTLDALGVVVVEPMASNSNSKINIIHPKKRLVKTSGTASSHLGPIIEANPNNASVVFSIRSGCGNFMFTGDIETDAWNRITGCYPYMDECRYYAVSHHGSITGHTRNTCAYKAITSLSDCFSGTSVQPLIMGRTGSYSGIPANDVLLSFPNVVYSEKDQAGNTKAFLEIEWDTKNMAWH